MPLFYISRNNHQIVLYSQLKSPVKKLTGLSLNKKSLNETDALRQWFRRGLGLWK